jgi:hypothetical protein
MVGAHQKGGGHGSAEAPYDPPRPVGWERAQLRYEFRYDPLSQPGSLHHTPS